MRQRKTGFRRPNRRMYHQIGVCGPSIGRVGCGCVTLIVDTSASMSKLELEHCLAEIHELSVEFSPELMTVITFDTEVRTVREYTAGEEIHEIEIGSRGGTDVLHVFNYIEEHMIKTNVMIFLTDMGFHAFPDTPEYPVLWVNTEGGRPDVPFGDVVNIEIPH
jgi:predicted metal-dependent peptidase